VGRDRQHHDSLRSVRLPEAVRRQAGPASKRAGEMALIREPGRRRDLRGRTVGVDELSGSPVEPQPPLKAGNRDAVMFPEFARQMRRVHAGDRGEIANRQAAEKVRVQEIDDSTDSKVQPLYHVILLNDEDHTYDYVVEMLVKIFKMSDAEAFSHAVEVDTKGTTILLTCELSKAELKRDQIHSYGPDWRLPRSMGSMAAIVEPAG